MVFIQKNDKNKEKRVKTFITKIEILKVKKKNP